MISLDKFLTHPGFAEPLADIQLPVLSETSAGFVVCQTIYNVCNRGSYQ